MQLFRAHAVLSYKTRASPALSLTLAGLFSDERWRLIVFFFFRLCAFEKLREGRDRLVLEEQFYFRFSNSVYVKFY